MTPHRNRAAIVATAVIQVICNALRNWIDGDTHALAVRAAIEDLLHDEFQDVERTTRSEIRSEDE